MKIVNIKSLIIILFSLFFLSFNFTALAQDDSPRRNLGNAFGDESVLDETSKEAGYKLDQDGDQMLMEIIGQVINIFLSILGVVFMILVIIAGYKWMTAAGNEEQVTQAKSYLKYAIIGLFVITLTWGIWTLLIPIIEAF